MVEFMTFPQGRDVRLDWFSAHDPASENFPIREVLPASIQSRPMTWRRGPVIEQGYSPGSVGYAFSTEIMTAPRPIFAAKKNEGEEYGRRINREIETYTDLRPPGVKAGASVLAGARYCWSRGFSDEYRWAFSIEDVRDAVLMIGTVVVGIPWFISMYQPLATSLVKVEGDLIGGHAVVITGFNPAFRLEDRSTVPVFDFRNSFGITYGNGGDAMIRYEDLRDLLAMSGEACVPVGRKLVRFD